MFNFHVSWEVISTHQIIYFLIKERHFKALNQFDIQLALHNLENVMTKRWPKLFLQNIAILGCVYNLVDFTKSSLTLVI